MTIGSRGAALPLFALVLGGLMGFAGLAVDVGYLEYQQQVQQSATDAAAIGGAQQLLYSQCPNSSAATTAADLDAANNGFSSGGNRTITVKNPPSSGPYANNQCAVSVTVGSQKVPTWFTRLFAFGQGASESTTAVAVASFNNNGCIYLLSATSASDMSNGTINASACSVMMNDTANMSNGTIDAQKIGYAAAAPNIGGTNFPEATPAPVAQFSDPCPEIAGCNYLAQNPPSTTGCGAGGTYASATLYQGCYNKLSLSGSVTLTGGLYVINGQFHMNNATVKGSGVTFYLTSNVQDTNFSSANLTLSPPTTGNTIGVLMYRVPSQTSAVDFSSCTCNFGGLLYFPKTQVDYSTVGGNYQVLVFGSANFSSSSNQIFGTPPPGQTLVGTAALGQ